MTGIVTGLLCRVSDGDQVRTYLLTDAPYHDTGLASQIEYGTALSVIPRDAGLSISEEISFQPQGGSGNVGVSKIPLINTEGYFDDWGGWILSGLEQTIKRGYADQPWPEWRLLFDGRGRGKPEFVGRERVMVSVRDRFAYMSEPVADQVFSEDDVSNDRLINTTVPMVFGSAYQVDPLLTEPQVLKYAVGSNVNDVPRVQEGGNPSTPVFEFVPLGFQLFQSPTLEITCDVSGPAVEGWEEGDALASIGGFDDWDSSGHPDGWDVTEDAPHAVINEDSSGDAQVENTANVDGDTGWVTGTSYTAGENSLGPDASPVPNTSTLAEVVAADDGEYAKMTGPKLYTVLTLTGSGFSFGLSETVEPVGVEGRVIIETAGGGGPRIYTFGLRYPDGFVRAVASIESIPSSKTTLDFGGSTQLPFGLTKEILEDPDFEVFLHVRNTDTSPTGALDIRVHQIAIKVHYGTIVDRLRLTSQSDVMTSGNRYLLRVHTEGNSGDSIHAYWGGVSSHSDDLSITDNPYAQLDTQLEGQDVHEFSFVASGPKFAIEFDRGDGNGEQTISSLQLLDKTASRERYTELMKYIHETADRDPDEVCDVDSFDLVQTQASNPRLGWYVSDQTSRGQLAVVFSHSLGATCWGGIDGLYHAAQMRAPEQPEGEYLSIVGSFESGHARPDQGEDLRDRVHAARNVKPLRESETAGVTTTWPEEQRQQVITKWRITEKADWANLVGYPTLTFTGIDPATGSVDGGTNVTGTGAGFSDFNAAAGDTITVAGNALQNITIVSDTEFNGDTPASDGGATGSADMTITIGGQSATLEGGFEYVTDYETEVLADSPVRYWKLEETSGTTAADSSGNGADGSYVGSPILGASGLVVGSGSSMDTDSGAGRVEVPAADVPNFAVSDSFTVEMVIRAKTDQDDFGLISDDDETDGWSWWRIPPDTGIRWATNNGNVQTSAFTLVSGAVHHLAAVYDGSTGNVEWFIDGSSVESGNPNYQGPDNDVLNIGRRRIDDNSVDADMGHVAIYDKKLSATRIAAHASRVKSS